MSAVTTSQGIFRRRYFATVPSNPPTTYSLLIDSVDAPYFFDGALIFLSSVANPYWPGGQSFASTYFEMSPLNGELVDTYIDITLDLTEIGNLYCVLQSANSEVTPLNLVPGTNHITGFANRLSCTNGLLPTNSAKDIWLNFRSIFVQGPGPQPSPIPSPTPSPTPSSDPEITISDVTVTQAVPNAKLPGSTADYDLVLDKAAAITAKVSLINGPAIARPININVSLSLGETTSTLRSLTLSSAQDYSGKYVTFSPVSVADITATRLSIKTFSEGISDASIEKTIRVKRTSSIDLSYFPIVGTGNGPDLNDVQTHVAMATPLLEGMYPVAKGSVFSSVGSSVAASTKLDSDNLLGNDAIEEDLGQLELRAVMSQRNSTNANVAIGLVSDQYFDDHALDAAGMAPAPIPGQSLFQPHSALVRTNFWSATAHEVAHLFGIGHAYNAATVNSFWVDQNQPILDAADLMGQGSLRFRENLTGRWISSSEYSSLFQRLLISPSDPMVMVISGFVSETNTVQLLSAYFLPAGTTTPYEASAEGKIQLVDSEGEVVGQASFAPSFGLITDNGDIRPVSKSFFLVQIPIMDIPNNVQVVRNNQVLETFNPSSKLLIDAIKAVAETSYKAKPRVGRDILLIEAKLIEATLKGRACMRRRPNSSDEKQKILAVLELFNLRATITRLLKDSTEKTNELEITKAELLRVVDLDLLKTIPDQAVHWRRKSVTIDPVPDFCRKKSNTVVSIKTFTQGQYGLVVQNHDGTLTYQPTSNNMMTDRFSVTLQDLEGDISTKTITIVR
ncbi:MAG: hypothetical protein JST04_11075 [Bdellovibrionales bacterium]|nr:hypothetical protein [Bdellovibrionales bacterium]